MTDLVKRLRGPIGPLMCFHANGIAMTQEAADEIERLTDENRRLRKGISNVVDGLGRSYTNGSPKLSERAYELLCELNADSTEQTDD